MIRLEFQDGFVQTLGLPDDPPDVRLGLMQGLLYGLQVRLR